MPDKAAPAPVGPTSKPPQFDKQPPVRMPSQRKPRAIKGESEEQIEAPPFTNDHVVALARHLSMKRGDNPDASRFGVRNYQAQMENARDMLVAFFFIQKMMEASDGE